MIIAGLILLNAVFAMSELAIVSARPARLKVAADRGHKGARIALLLASDPGKFLSTVQIGITLVGIIAGAYSGASLGGPTAERLTALGLSDRQARSSIRLGFGRYTTRDELIEACRARYDVTVEEVRTTEENVVFKLPRLLVA